MRSIASWRDWATAASTSVLNSAIVFISEPSSALARIAASTSARFSAVTPLKPSAVKSAAVKDGDEETPAASPMSRVTSEANAATSP